MQLLSSAFYLVVTRKKIFKCTTVIIMADTHLNKILH